MSLECGFVLWWRATSNDIAEVAEILCLPPFLHSSVLMFLSTSALSASSAAISFMMTAGVR